MLAFSLRSYGCDSRLSSGTATKEELFAAESQMLEELGEQVT
jgi:hypothetical protein